MSTPEVVETHMSRVLLFDDQVLKVLKPVHYAFVDLRTRALRQAECESEVAHNAPWAPDVYLGVVEHDGEPAVHMRRLAADRTLCALRDALTPDDMERVGRFLRSRHDTMPARPRYSTPAAVWKRIDDNLAELIDLLDGAHGPLVDRITACRARLEPVCAPLLADRAEEGRQLHGDLRGEHVYLEADGVAVLDGVAFSEELSSGDPLEDVAFLAMDLGCTLARWDLVPALWRGWGIHGVSPLCELYAGHRSLIRAKVAGLQGKAALQLEHLVHTLAHWEEPARRPLLIGIGGLPGVGKSTLARQVAERHAVEVLRTDVVRKELGPPDYSDAGRRRVYDAVLERARQVLVNGGRVLIDASLGKQAWREQILALGDGLGVRTLFLMAEADEQVALSRIAARTNDASDADARVYRLAKEAWEPVEGRVRRSTHVIRTDGTLQASAEAVDAVVR